MKLRATVILFLCFLASCNQAALVVQQQKVDSKYLASANVGSPDPRRSPNGQMILAEWWLPKSVLNACPSLKMDIVFCDGTQECIEFPVQSKVGYETYALLNDKFKEKGGFRAYRVEIVTEDGQVYANWQHQLWVKLIDLDDETDEISVITDEKSRQLSVIETPSCISPN